LGDGCGDESDGCDDDAGCVVPTAFAGLVRVSAHQDGADDARDLGQGGQQADVEEVGYAPARYKRLSQIAASTGNDVHSGRPLKEPHEADDHDDQ
jgi:hypothetical protein